MINNYSGDYFIKLLKDLYRKNGTSLPQSDFATLQRLVDEERANQEKYRAWLRLQDSRIGASSLDLPFVPLNPGSSLLEEDKASITVQIPSGYKHLQFKVTGRINGSGGQAFVYLVARFNGDSGNNYNHSYSGQSGATSVYGEVLGISYFRAGFLVADGSPADWAGSFVTEIPHYLSSYYKQAINLMGVSNAASGTSTVLRYGVWKNTSRIETVTFLPDPTYASAKIEAGTLISVYGVR